jgi:hypothetical protein
MENNDKQDKFEQFLQIILGKHEEQAPDTAWTQIHARMPISKAPKQLSFGAKYSAYLVAASFVTVFACLSMWQHQYAYTLALKNAQTIEAQRLTIQQLQTELATNSPKELQHNQIDDQTKHQKSWDRSHLAIAPTTTQIGQSNHKKSKVWARRIDLEQKQSILDTKTLNSDTSRDQIEDVLGNETAYTHTTNTKALGIDNVSQQETGTIPQPQIADHQTIPRDSPQTSTLPDTKAQTAYTNLGIIERLGRYAGAQQLQSSAPTTTYYPRPTHIAPKSTPRTKLAVYTTLGHTKQSIEVRKDRQNRPDNYAAQDYAIQGRYQQIGVGAITQLRNRWQISGGLALARIEQDARHVIKLKPKHHVGNGGGGGGGNDSLRFDYTVQTGSGLIDVDVRAIDTATQMLNSDVELSLKTRETARFLQIPMSVRYSVWTDGRWSAGIEAGILLNLPTYSRVEVNGLEINSPKPVFADPKQRNIAKIRQGGPQDIHFWSSVGTNLEYKLDRWNSIVLSATFQKKVDQSLENGWAKHRFSLAGLRFGLCHQI